MSKGGSIWIIGYTRSGKSPFAQQLATRLNLPILEAGRFAREQFGNNGDVSETTARAEAMLRGDHRYYSRLINAFACRRNMIIVGVRNPIDFVDSFEPATDSVIFLNAGNGAATEFEEKGIAAIRAILAFLMGVGSLPRDRVETRIAQKEVENWYDETRP